MDVNDFSERLKAYFSAEFIGGHYNVSDGGCPTCGYGGTKAMSLETIRWVIDEFTKNYIKKENDKSGTSKGNS